MKNVELHTIRHGNVAMANNPFELFFDYANRIKARNYAKQTFIVQLCCGCHGFPKGHMESGETEVETTLREVYEETNVNIELIDGFREKVEYKNPKNNDTIKQVTYLLGEFRNQKVIWQSKELSEAYLVTYAEAMNLLQFESLKHILGEADNYINAKDM